LVAVRLLVVDDHVGFRSLARRLLTAAGFHVVGEAGTGAEGVAVSASLCPDAVLLDIQLPDADGFEVSQRLSEQPDPPAIVLTSARPLAHYGARTVPDAVRGFLPKAELTGAALTEVLEGRR
jgi:two-component system nitrate/nitrite response regulator NarL